MVRWLTISVVLLLAAGGCSHTPPSLKITGVSVGDRSEAGLVLNIGVEAENRNEVELPLREVRYTVKLEDGRGFSGVRSPEATLRRLGTQRMSLPAVFALGPESPAPTGVVKCEVSGTLNYISPGELAQTLLDTGVRRPSVSFKELTVVDFGAGR